MSCTVCPRRCAQRSSGFCGVGDKILVGRIEPHFWEEPVISGSKGSGTVFFSGCSLRCVFCQNRAISRELVGKAISAQQLHEHICRMLEKGVHNINFVTPTHYAGFLAEFLENHQYPVPVIYNCSGYENVQTLEALRGKVQIFLPDFKYSDEALARAYSSAPGYVDIAERALEKMYALVGDVQINAAGLMEKGVLVRHLMLPGALENTLGVIDRFECFSRGKKLLFSLMNQYTPVGDLSAFPQLCKRLPQEEYTKALNYMALLGIDGFCQEPESADEIYIPPFSAEWK
ncbi:MAG: radical SAM protein [Ruminococcaceae bacterium]|nr:radical SAM protein [Oscillospiraceae bacterium]